MKIGVVLIILTSAMIITGGIVWIAVSSSGSGSKQSNTTNATAFLGYQQYQQSNFSNITTSTNGTNKTLIQINTQTSEVNATEAINENQTTTTIVTSSGGQISNVKTMTNETININNNGSLSNENVTIKTTVSFGPNGTTINSVEVITFSNGTFEMFVRNVTYVNATSTPFSNTTNTSLTYIPVSHPYDHLGLCSNITFNSSNNNKNFTVLFNGNSQSMMLDNSVNFALVNPYGYTNNTIVPVVNSTFSNQQMLIGNISDNLIIPSASVQLNNFSFGLSFNGWSQPYQGVFGWGMGSNMLSAISASNNLSNVYSISLNSSSAGSFIVGGSDPSASGLPAYSFSQVNSTNGYFYINVNSINGIPSVSAMSPNPYYQSIIEPGLQYIDIPSYFTNTSNNNLITFSSTLTSSQQGCYLSSNLLHCACNSTLPNYGLNNLTFSVQAGLSPNFFLVNLIITPTQYMKKYSNGVCSTFIRPVSMASGNPVLGTDFLKSFYTTFNVNGTSSVLEIAAIPGVSIIDTQNTFYLPHLLSYGN